MPSSYARQSFLNRQLPGVMNASINGVPMRLNPTGVEVSYTLKTSETPTLGGMVVQVFGLEISDLIVTGSFGIGGYQEQAEFLRRMLNIAGYQANQHFNSAGGPVTFLYPNRGFNFQVYLKAYESSGGMAIDYENVNIAPDWKLTLFVDTDNTGGTYTKVAADAYIQRLSNGLGYKMTQFQGNVTADLKGNPSKVADFLASQGFANDPQGYLKVAFGNPAQQTTTDTTAATGSSSGGSQDTTGGTGAGRYSGAKWLPVKNHSGAMSGHKGLVLHVCQGNGSQYNHFNSGGPEDGSNVSAHFWVGKDGTVEQYVDGNDTAWHAMGANDTYNGVETEGFTTEALTSQQVTAVAGIYQWGMKSYGWPKALCDKVGDAGFAWHGLGGDAWGAHPYCPGDLRKAQRADILKLIK